LGAGSFLPGCPAPGAEQLPRLPPLPPGERGAPPARSAWWWWDRSPRGSRWFSPQLPSRTVEWSPRGMSGFCLQVRFAPGLDAGPTLGPSDAPAHGPHRPPSPHNALAGPSVSPASFRPWFVSRPPHQPTRTSCADHGEGGGGAQGGGAVRGPCPRHGPPATAPRGRRRHHWLGGSRTPPPSPLPFQWSSCLPQGPRRQGGGARGCARWRRTWPRSSRPSPFAPVAPSAISSSRRSTPSPTVPCH